MDAGLEGGMERGLNEFMDESLGGGMYGGMDAQKCEWIELMLDGRRDGWMDGCE